jgi:hypothetical protein
MDAETGQGSSEVALAGDQRDSAAGDRTSTISAARTPEEDPLVDTADDGDERKAPRPTHHHQTSGGHAARRAAKRRRRSVQTASGSALRSTAQDGRRKGLSLVADAPAGLSWGSDIAMSRTRMRETVWRIGRDGCPGSATRRIDRPASEGGALGHPAVLSFLLRATSDRDRGNECVHNEARSGPPGADPCFPGEATSSGGAAGRKHLQCRRGRDTDDDRWDGAHRESVTGAGSPCPMRVLPPRVRKPARTHGTCWNGSGWTCCWLGK